jgi:Rrf2 family protein
MRLTLHTDYAMPVPMFAGSKGEALATISEIVALFDISRGHVMKVVQALGRKGYLETIRGNKGCIRLARKPMQINIGAVVRDMEETLDIVGCLERGGLLLHTDVLRAEERSAPTRPTHFSPPSTITRSRTWYGRGARSRGCLRSRQIPRPLPGKIVQVEAGGEEISRCISRCSCSSSRSRSGRAPLSRHRISRSIRSYANCRRRSPPAAQSSLSAGGDPRLALIRQTSRSDRVALSSICRSGVAQPLHSRLLQTGHAIEKNLTTVVGILAQFSRCDQNP